MLKHDDRCRRVSTGYETVQFINPGLILTQMASPREHGSINIRDILLFLEANRHMIHNVKFTKIELRPLADREKDAEDFEKSQLEIDVKRICDSIEAEIFEFDDEFEGHELLFSIILNKWVIIVFHRSCKFFTTNFFPGTCA